MAVALAALGATSARAEEAKAPAEEQRDGESKGFKLGGARLHPFGDVQLHYVYNPGRQGTGGAIYNDLMITPHGGAELEYEGDIMDLRLSLDGEGRIFTGVENAATQRLTSGAAVIKANALFNKGGAFTVRVTDELKPIAADFTQSNAQFLLHTSNDAGVTVDAMPGGGALVFTTAFSAFVDYYHPNAGLNSGLQDNVRLTPHFKAAWKFLPKTALFLDADLVISNYFSDPARRDNWDFILKVFVGANGNITSRLSALLKIGYGDTFSADAFRSVVALAEVSYAVTETAKVGVGYSRNVIPIALYTYSAVDYGYARYSHLIAGMVQLDADAGFAFVQYGQDPAGNSNREDIRFTANLAVDVYIIDDWLSVGLADRLMYNGVNAAYSTSVGGVISTYFTNDLFLRVSAKY